MECTGKKCLSEGLIFEWVCTSHFQSISSCFTLCSDSVIVAEKNFINQGLTPKLKLNECTWIILCTLKVWTIYWKPFYSVLKFYYWIEEDNYKLVVMIKKLLVVNLLILYMIHKLWKIKAGRRRYVNNWVRVWRIRKKRRVFSTFPLSDNVKSRLIGRRSHFDQFVSIFI